MAPPSATPPPPPPRPAPELVGDVVAEILLRLPPDDPAGLVRASLVCKPWLRILSSAAFRRRYRAFHRAPPLLGFLHNAFHRLDRFVPTATSPISQPAIKFHCWRALDSRHGRALLDASPDGADLIVWDPISGDLQKLPIPDVPEFLNRIAAVLCSAAGCDHRDCRGGPFLVVNVSNYEETCATVYSSESGAWSPPTSLQLDGDDGCIPAVPKPGVLVGDALYFLLSGGMQILKFDIGEHCLSVINPPFVRNEGIALLANEGIALTVVEECVLGFAVLEDHTLTLWSMDARSLDDDGVARWSQHRVIELQGMVPSLRPQLIGYAEDADTMVFMAIGGVFTVELKTMQVRKVCESGYSPTVVPYTSFCIPDVHQARISRERMQWERTEEAETVGGGGSNKGTRQRLPRVAKMGCSSSERPRQRPTLNASMTNSSLRRQRQQEGRPVNSCPADNVSCLSGRARRTLSQTVTRRWIP